MKQINSTQNKEVFQPSERFGLRCVYELVYEIYGSAEQKSNAAQTDASQVHVYLEDNDKNYMNKICIYMCVFLYVKYISHVQ